MILNDTRNIYTKIVVENSNSNSDDFKNFMNDLRAVVQHHNIIVTCQKTDVFSFCINTKNYESELV